VAQALHAIETADTGDADAMRSALARTQALLRRIGTERVQDLLAGVTDSLPSLAGELGKAAPLVAIEDNGLAVRSQVGGLLKNLFTHLMRNAVDHGIEAPDVRTAAGKPAAGRIELVLGTDADTFTMVLRDDGRGMALKRIREIAIERGLLDAAAKPGDEETAQLVFLPGFSTATHVTEVSGRGVGMDAVKSFLEREGGRIDVRFLGPVRSSGHRPFEFVITLPANLAVRVGEPAPARNAATPAAGSSARSATGAPRASTPELDEPISAK
jgi:chemotaxis protein histidine kinase CheA